MNQRDYEQSPSGSTIGAAALFVGLAVGAAALLLSTKPGQKIWGQFADRAEDWKAQAAAAVAETREKVVSSVDSDTPRPDEGASRVRERL